MSLHPTAPESARAVEVFEAILDCVRRDEAIKLPPFDASQSQPAEHVALQSVGIEPNPFGGRVGDYRYQFEGEEDLLHLIVTRNDGAELTPEEAQQVAGFLLPNVPPAVIWLKPGQFTQHFYVGHDELLS